MAKMKLSDTWRPYRKHCQLYVVKGSRFGLMWNERGKRPHKKPVSHFARYCRPTCYPLAVSQRIFTGLSICWARGWGYLYDPYPPEPRTIDKEAWKNFAAEIDYYITPTQTTKLTGFKAFIAWNRTALEAQYLWMYCMPPWAKGYPYVQWPNPPPSYSPILTRSVTVRWWPWWNWLAYTPNPQPPQVQRIALMYTSGRAFPARYETKRPQTFIYTEDRLPVDPPPDEYVDNMKQRQLWRCHGSGYITPYLQIVDGATGSPAPLVTGPNIWMP